MPSASAGVSELLLAKLDAVLAEFDTVADHAAYGETINDLDAFLLVAGRSLIKEIFEQKLQERITHKEHTQEAAQCKNCKKTQMHNTKHEAAKTLSTRERRDDVRCRWDLGSHSQ